MNQPDLKWKTISCILRSLLLVSLILWALQPMGALGEALSLSNYHVTTVYHRNLPGGFASAGEIFLGHGNLYSTYCINLDVSTYRNVIYNRGSELDNGKIIYILNNYYPVVAGKPSELSLEYRDAAVQLAIWHYTDGLNIGTGGRPSAIFNAARNIIADTESNYLKTYAITFDPLSAGCVGSEITIKAKLTLGSSPVVGKTVSFSVTGSNPIAGSPIATDDSGYATFKYTPTIAGTDTITATVQDIIPAGVIWVSQGHQSLVSAGKKPLSTPVSLSINPVPVVLATVAAVCAGNAAQMVGSVTTDNCAAGTLTYKWFRVEGSSETSLADGSKYTGTGALTLNILDAVPADAGTYRLKVTCSGTQCTGVADAVLSVNPSTCSLGNRRCSLRWQYCSNGRLSNDR